MAFISGSNPSNIDSLRPSLRKEVEARNRRSSGSGSSSSSNVNYSDSGYSSIGGFDSFTKDVFGGSKDKKILGQLEKSGSLKSSGPSYKSSGSSSKGSSGGELSSSQISPGETGTGGSLFFMTPKEASSYKGVQPVWSVQSLKPREALEIEPTWSGVARQGTKTDFSKSSFGELPKGEHERNTYFIDSAQEGFQKEKAFLTDYNQISQAFKTSPQKFSGEKGFESLSTKGGITYSLSSEYFENIPSYKNYASMFNEKGILEFGGNSFKESLPSIRKEFHKKPFSVQAKSYWGQALVGGSQFTLGALDFAKAVIPKQAFYIKDGAKLNKVSSPSISSSMDWSSNIMSIPTSTSTFKFTSNPLKWIGETAIERPGASVKILGSEAMGYGLVKGGVKNIKTLGFKEGIPETLSFVTPLRIKSGLFTPSSSEKYDLKTFEMTKGGSSSQVSWGKSQDFGINVWSVQTGVKSGKINKITSATAMDNIPFAEFKGGKLSFGKTKLSSVSFSEATGSPIGKGMGSKLNSYTFYKSPKFGQGVSYRNIDFGYRENFMTTPKFDSFGYFGGEGKAIKGDLFEMNKFTGKSTKSGEFSKPYFDPKVRGFGFNIKSIEKVSPGTQTIKVFTGGGKKSSGDFLKNMYKDSLVVVQKSKSPSYNLPKPKSTSVLKLKTPTVTGIENIPLLKVKKSGLGYSSYQSLKPATSLKTSPVSMFSPGLLPNLKSVQGTTPIESLKINSVLKQGATQKAVSVYQSISPPSSFKFPIAPIVPIGLFPLLIPPIRPQARRSYGGKAIGGKELRGYTPSFTAFIYNIKGKKTLPSFGGKYTGFEIRKIPKGFSWKNLKVTSI